MSRFDGYWSTDPAYQQTSVCVATNDDHLLHPVYQQLYLKLQEILYFQSILENIMNSLIMICRPLRSFLCTNVFCLFFQIHENNIFYILKKIFLTKFFKTFFFTILIFFFTYIFWIFFSSNTYICNDIGMILIQLNSNSYSNFVKFG